MFISEFIACVLWQWMVLRFLFLYIPVRNEYPKGIITFFMRLESSIRCAYIISIPSSFALAIINSFDSVLWRTAKAVAAHSGICRCAHGAFCLFGQIIYRSLSHWFVEIASLSQHTTSWTRDNRTGRPDCWLYDYFRNFSFDVWIRIADRFFLF